MIDHRRNQNGVANVLALDSLTEALRTELWNRNLGRTERRRRKHRGKVGDVKDGCGMEKHAALGVSHPVIQMIDIGQNVSVSDHHALGMAGSSARVNKSQNRVRIINYIGRRIVSSFQGILIEHPLPGYWHGRSRQGRMHGRVRVESNRRAPDRFPPGRAECSAERQ